MTTWPLQRDCATFYGDPSTASGKASAKWESANLVSVKCPWVLRYDGKPVSGIRIHKKSAASLERVLAAIWARVGQSQSEIDRIGMSIYGGGYNYRAMRGGSSLSMHSYGCAVDFDPARNALGSKSMAMDRRVIEEFEREGWEWGGHWSRPDGMHFQAARTKASPKRLSASVTVAKPPAKAAKASNSEIEALQTQLKNLGYHEVGLIDGDLGSKTRGALLAFKADNGLPLTLDLNDMTWLALAKAKPRPAPAGRETAITAPSPAAKAAKVTEVIGGAAIAIGTAETITQPVGGLSGIVDKISGAGDALRKAREIVDPIRDLVSSIADNWMIALLLVGIGLFSLGRYVFKDELASWRSGEWS